jgi:hypothetical protein
MWTALLLLGEGMIVVKFEQLESVWDALMTIAAKARLSVEIKIKKVA